MRILWVNVAKQHDNLHRKADVPSSDWSITKAKLLCNAVSSKTDNFTCGFKQLILDVPNGTTMCETMKEIF